jgi:hypothetical protein
MKIQNQPLCEKLFKDPESYHKILDDTKILKEWVMIN